MKIQQPPHNLWRSLSIVGAASSFPLNLIMMIWLIQYGTASELNSAYAYISAVPALSMLTKFWIIFSTSFRPDRTLCCYCGWMIGHFLLIFPSLAINLVFMI